MLQPQHLATTQYVLRLHAALGVQYRIVKADGCPVQGLSVQLV